MCSSGDDTVWCKYCGCRLDLDGCGQWQSRRQVRPGEEPSSSSSTAVHLHYHHPLEFCHQDHFRLDDVDQKQLFSAIIVRSFVTKTILPRLLSNHPHSSTAVPLHNHNPKFCHQHQSEAFHQHHHLPFFCHQEQGPCFQPSFLSSPFSPSGRPCVFLRSKS